MWGNPALLHRAKSIEKNIEKKLILAKTIEKILRKDKYFQ